MHPRLWYRQGEVLSGCAIYLMFSSPVNTRPSSVPAHQGLWSLPTRLPGEASSQCWDAPGGTRGSETRCKRQQAAWPSVCMSAPPQNEETSLRSCFSSGPGWFSEQHRCLCSVAAALCWRRRRPSPAAGGSPLLTPAVWAQQQRQHHNLWSVLGLLVHVKNLPEPQHRCESICRRFWSHFTFRSVLV